jgi:hypothetical protein
VTLNHPVFDHVPPWTEEEYLALDETTSLVELVRGALWVSPSPHNTLHQEVVGRVVTALLSGAENTGFDAVRQINVRLAPDTILNPDFVVSKTDNRPRLVTDAADIRLIGEVTAPGSALADRTFKPHLYAAAGIEWYLLVETDFSDLSVSLRLHRLAGDHYVKDTAAKFGQTLKSDAPFPFTIDTTDLAEPAADAQAID